ncbi:ATP-binding cassette domain-containing protein [Rhizobium leguminosarum]|nr:ATP-binding cassette domain-containing protein [Rhizobium leguminosarum]
MSSPVLNVRGLRKTYGGVVTLKGVDFDLMPGEIHGLCGENGAGKSTLVKILGGLVAPTEGNRSRRRPTQGRPTNRPSADLDRPSCSSRRSTMASTPPRPSLTSSTARR